MAELRISGAAADIMRLFNTVDERARTQPKTGSDGSFLPIGARRVDALLDLVTGSGVARRASPAAEGDRTDHHRRSHPARIAKQPR